MNSKELVSKSEETENVSKSENENARKTHQNASGRLFKNRRFADTLCGNLRRPETPILLLARGHMHSQQVVAAHGCPVAADTHTRGALEILHHAHHVGKHNLQQLKTTRFKAKHRYNETLVF